MKQTFLELKDENERDLLIALEDISVVLAETEERCVIYRANDSLGGGGITVGVPFEDILVLLKEIITG